MLVGTNHRKILYHLMKTITISLLWIFFKADLHGTTLSHAICLPQVYNTSCFT